MNIENPPTAIEKTKKRKMIVIIFWSIVATLGMIGFCLWVWIFKDVKYTSDAYVEGNQLVITPLVDGFVTSIHTDDTFLVKKGDLLVQLDDTDAMIAFNQAKENFAQTVRHVCTLYHQAFAYKSEIAIRKAELIKAEEFYNHRFDVLEQGAISLEDLQASRAILDASFNAYQLAKSIYLKEIALIQNKSIRTNPLVQASADLLTQAWVNLYRCNIYSPVEGLVAQRTVQVGMWSKSGTPMMSVIPLDQIWVNANYKETQMRHMKIGQHVELFADMYGHDVKYRGKIVGLPGGAGNAFSILPPQNLSGNWIKIVQRLPVRVSLDPDDLTVHPLRIGMTMRAKVNIRDQNGSYLPTTSKGSPLYKTSIYHKELQNSQELVESIFEQNLDPTLSVYSKTPFNGSLIEAPL